MVMGNESTNDHVRAEEHDLSILDQDRGAGGPRATYREQRRLINSIVNGEIGETPKEKARMRAHLVETAVRWMESDEQRLQARGVRLGLKLERQKLRTLAAVTAAVDSDRRAMIEVAKAQAANEPPQEGVNSVAQVVAIARPVAVGIVEEVQRAIVAEVGHAVVIVIDGVVTAIADVLVVRHSVAICIVVVNLRAKLQLNVINPCDSRLGCVKDDQLNEINIFNTERYIL